MPTYISTVPQEIIKLTNLHCNLKCNLDPPGVSRTQTPQQQHLGLTRSLYDEWSTSRHRNYRIIRKATGLCNTRAIYSLLAQFPLGTIPFSCVKNERISFKRRELFQSGNIHSGNTTLCPCGNVPKLCNIQRSSPLIQLSRHKPRIAVIAFTNLNPLITQQHGYVSFQSIRLSLLRDVGLVSAANVNGRYLARLLILITNSHVHTLISVPQETTTLTNRTPQITYNSIQLNNVDRQGSTSIIVPDRQYCIPLFDSVITIFVNLRLSLVSN